MTDTNNQPPTEAAPAGTKPRWEAPRLEMLPISMSRNFKPSKPNDVSSGPGTS